MKILLILTCCICTWSVHAQNSALLKPRTYRVTIMQLSNTPVKGWLTDITDAGIVVSASETQFRDTVFLGTDLHQISYTQIDRISLKRKGGGARGFAIGLLGGFAAGAIVGLVAAGDQSGFIKISSGESALAGGVLLGVPGMLVGTIIGGAAKKTFIIKGSAEKFQELRLHVLQKSYRKSA